MQYFFIVIILLFHYWK